MKDFNFYLNQTREVGFVEQVNNMIVYADGLPNIKPEEIVLFEGGEFGMALSLTRETVEILVFSEKSARNGTKVVRTNEFIKVPVGNELLGNIIDPMGNPITPMRRAHPPTSYRWINSPATGILTRKTINRQLATGVPIVDLIMPLGFGQRELVIGDRKTGKTNFLMQTILSQARDGNICIYAAIGKEMLDIKETEEFFRKNGIMDHVIIVSSRFQDPIGMTYLVPYSGMTIAEYFRDEGNDVLLVLDDLTTHAKSYREMSLLGKRFPGRSSYPGDIFYTHARLLERAGNFITQKGEKSITCLPVVESTQGDLSGYIQTNVTSMTDGHLYFDSDLFAKGRRPAINPFLSVTRVGRQTQSNLKRDINREIFSFLTIYEKMQNFSHFGAELNETIRITLSFGEKLTSYLDQPLSTITPLNLQIVLFAMLWNSKMQNITLEPIGHDLEKIVNVYNTNRDARKEVDDLVASSASFNNLLIEIREKGENLLQKLKSYDK